MTKTPHELVLEWHKTMGVPVGNTPHILNETREKLRLKLINEEYLELDDALFHESVVEIADALGDMVYVIYGMAIEMGINLDTIITEIHRSNMTKLGEDGKPIYREDGKVLKGPNYEPPQIAQVLSTL